MQPWEWYVHKAVFSKDGTRLNIMFKNKYNWSKRLEFDMEDIQQLREALERYELQKQSRRL